MNLETFDTMDFEVFSHQDWSRLGESHSPYVRVHWPDGHYTDGLDQRTQDITALFVWAPDLRIEAHPVRVAKDNLTAVLRGTFTQPMPDGQGGTIASTGKAFALDMITVGIWNRQGTMDEEFLFWDARPSPRNRAGLTAWPRSDAVSPASPFTTSRSAPCWPSP